jgi:hypothetical protein
MPERKSYMGDCEDPLLDYLISSDLHDQYILHHFLVLPLVS